MQIEGLDPSEITKLHGELIALNWVEQNAGQVPTCYPITLAGFRAVRHAEAQEMKRTICKKRPGEAHFWPYWTLIRSQPPSRLC